MINGSSNLVKQIIVKAISIFLQRKEHNNNRIKVASMYRKERF